MRQVEGRLGKFYGQVALLEQECLVELEDAPPAKKKKGENTVAHAVARQARALGLDGLEVAGFVRYACGEGDEA